MELPLKNKKKEIIAYTIVSKEDYKHLSQFKWYKSDKGYVTGYISKKKWQLHRYIMIVILGNELTPQNPIDHKNNNPLDNTRDNLRLVTVSENARNKKKKESTSSKYIGVSFKKDKNKWAVSICIDNKRLFATYNNEIHAAYQYNLWIDEYNLINVNKNEIEKPKNFVKWIAKEKNDINLPVGITNFDTKFRVRITINNIRKSIGLYDKLDDAKIALENAKIEKEKIEKETLLSIPKKFNENGQCIFKIKETEVIIDEEMYYDIIKYKWSISKYGYIRGNKNPRLSRYIMNYSGNDFVDHINNNKLDNRRENLRIVTVEQNNLNKSSAKGSLSKYVGVSFEKKRNKWFAQICHKGKTKFLGYFTNEIDAAKTRDIATKEYFGEYGKLNFTGI